MSIHKLETNFTFTSNFKILFEKRLFKQLYEYFIDKKLFYNAQYAFRSEHSTNFAALDLVD